VRAAGGPQCVWARLTPASAGVLQLQCSRVLRRRPPVCIHRKIEVNPPRHTTCHSVTLCGMNEDIAVAFLALEARVAQSEQRLADVEFQLRQMRREVEDARRRVANCGENVDYLTNRVLRNEQQGGLAWPGRLKLN